MPLTLASAVLTIVVGADGAFPSIRIVLQYKKDFMKSLPCDRYHREVEILQVGV